jgi:hypothetical protein
MVKKHNVVLSVLAFALIIITLFIVILFWSEVYRPDWWGSNDLGDGFFCIEQDDRRMIVYGTSVRGNTCYGGIGIVPQLCSKPLAFNSYTSDYLPDVSVLEVYHDSRWIIARVFDNITKSTKYCIVSKQIADIIYRNEIDMNAYIFYFDEAESFRDYCETNEIDIFIE